MAADKSFEWRMQGMIYACKLAKEKGIEYLEKDIKKRGVLKADIIYKDSQVKEIWDNISKNIYTNMLVTVLWVLYDKYGFRKERLGKFKKYYDEAVRTTLDLDYMGEHYVKMQDYAIELNEQCNMGFDMRFLRRWMIRFSPKEYHGKKVVIKEGVVINLNNEVVTITEVMNNIGFYYKSELPHPVKECGFLADIL